MKLLLSDNHSHLRFAPLTLTRPIAELRCGLFTNTERWELLFPSSQIGYETENYLSGKFPTNEGIWINALCIANTQLADRIIDLQVGEALYQEGLLLAKNGAEKKRIECNFVDLILLENRWDLYLKNEAILRQDFKLATNQSVSKELSRTNLLIGPAQDLFIEEGACIEGATLNTTHGPIYIGRNAEIMEGSMLRGPLAVMDGAVVKMGAKIYGATTIGPECRIGGEVNNSIFQAYSNKGHDGFIGNALIGEWCNLGADTNCSNLKNNYSKVSTYSYEKQQQVATNEIFMGLTMGDHSKSAINVQFNTATVVGVSSNIFCSQFPDKFVASFQWHSDEQTEAYRLDKAIEAATAMMARRKQEFSQHDTEIFNYLAKN